MPEFEGGYFTPWGGGTFYDEVLAPTKLVGVSRM